jgi:putative membrane protein
MAKSLMLAIVLGVGLGAIGSAQSSSSDQGGQKSASSGSTSKSGVSLADEKFVEKAAQGGMAEVELGQLATQKASSDDVKSSARGWSMITAKRMRS